MSIQKLLEPYLIEVSDVKKMEGYDSDNYFLTDQQNKRYVLKHYTDPTEYPNIKAEIDILIILSKKVNFKIPTSLPNVAGDYIHRYSDNSFSRLIEYIDGQVLSETEESQPLLNSLGQRIAQLDLALKGLKNPAIQARRGSWDLQYCLINEPKLKHIQAASLRKLVNYIYDKYRSEVLPLLPELRHSIIHGDLDYLNILAVKNEVVGFIDFNDLSYTPLVNELAIALAYVMLEKSDPIGTAEAVIRGYHDIYPLERSEIELLPQLIPVRWATNVCNTAEARFKGGHLEHKLIHEKKVQNILQRWFIFNPVEIQNRFLTAAGFKPNDYQAQRTTVLKTRRKTTSPALGLTYESPLYIHSAAFQYMYDYDGNTYLDARNNIPQVGHSHPKVSEAISRQVRMLNTNTRYLYDSMAAYSEKLLDHFPDKLCRIFYVNSGSAASDLAIRLARTFTARSGQLVLENGYHGNTKIGIDISSYKFDGKGGQGPAAFVTKLPLPKIFQGEFDNGEDFAQQALGIINNIEETPAAFIAEPISGGGGQVPLAPGYLKTIKPELERNKILTIIDEVQTGFGRLGQYFWGFEMHGIEPDIVILGKPMGNGQPIAAVVTTTEISEAFDNGIEFFSSFGGNSVSTAAALAVLAVLEEEALPDNAQHIGEYIKEKLKFMAVDHSAIGDIRGTGLFLGVEFIDPETNSPATKLTAQVKKRLKDNFILVGSDGPANNVLKIKPPLCFNQGNADELCSTLQKILKEQNA